MRKIVRFLGIVLVIGFIAIQFFQPEKNNAPITENHIFRYEQVPEDIQTVINNACMDCHSNHTNYLWYHRITPVSWMVSKHVTNGKEELNFSEWGEMDVFEKITKLEEICQETERKTMPIKSYKVLHSEAKLTDEQISDICNWSTKLSEDLLAKAIESD
ncbi:heme-binding domain-containing protein [Prolixibacteraceae bacterium Z1-6]|uniref:Heme-binding domain-containing protein n=1 Tax=Draconibacterium aestuarii TaxID=2998507 RepID=A0A9X3J550_9BACT|nr:heme-binding domain-containing protein [Prolixibacteraceae bacterium Z1-6]